MFICCVFPDDVFPLLWVWCVVSLRLSLLCFRVSRVSRVCGGFRWYGDGPGRVWILSGPSCYVWCGGVLLSHTLSGAVPSPCQVLASGFGMGPGVSPGPWPPQICDYHPGDPCRVFPGGCVVGWGPDGGRVCAEGSVV